MMSSAPLRSFFGLFLLLWWPSIFFYFLWLSAYSLVISQRVFSARLRGLPVGTDGATVLLVCPCKGLASTCLDMAQKVLK